MDISASESCSDLDVEVGEEGMVSARKASRNAQHKDFKREGVHEVDARNKADLDLTVYKPLSLAVERLAYNSALEQLPKKEC